MQSESMNCKGDWTSNNQCCGICAVHINNHWFNTFQLIDGYDKHKTPKLITVRPMTHNEAISLQYGQHVNVIANNGTLRQVKVNGKPRTWKRQPTRFELPCKYGLYEYFTLNQDELHRLVIVID